MAEVLVSTQTIPIMNLHPADGYHGHSASQSHHAARSPQASRSFGTSNAPASYRAPVAPYAFQSTPNLRTDGRQNTNVAPSAHRQSAGSSTLANSRQNYAPSSSASTASSNSASNSSSNVGQQSLLKDDTLLLGKTGTRPESTFLTSSSTPDLTLVSFDNTSKPSPERYRRTAKRVDSSSSVVGNQQAGNSQRFSQQWPTPQAAHQALNAAFKGPTGHTRSESADDIIVGRQSGSGRYRRRSIGALDTSNTSRQATPPATSPAPTWSQIAARGHSAVASANASPPALHHRNDSAGSHSSTGSTSARRPVNARQESYSSTKSTSSRPGTAPTMVPRPSSPRTGADVSKRVISPSPLSKPISSEPEKRLAPPPDLDRPASPQVRPTTANAQSAAVQQLSALSDRDQNKGMKSRLRRAFSFGSAQELRRASAQNSANKLRKEKSDEEERLAEDAAVAAQQEAAGIGASIYSGQGGVYGSTDNLSIQSTASSASVMLRKMGKGVKKSTKSLRGLFRPKSIIGDPAADNAVSSPSAAEAAVTLVTVEAEREKLNVNPDPHERSGGGTAYPKLERASVEVKPVTNVERPSSSRHVPSDSTSSRKSIVGGDRERQEVLAAVKKGILKRNNTSSPVHNEPNPSELTVPSIPSTPDGSNSGDAFFMNNTFSNDSSRSLPERNGPIRNISWNPKVQFFDVFASSEYDRRGDIATCNRLTPMLAQQIKEELNSFKMEMEVHEMSKPHTHFF
ncbi:uncharacterized protein PV09_03956 [Verruconis gallopava]|uniref:Protein BNI4 n=1 Tax=Verruconis gallopava TaxID=253628 RepID=A0A0D2AE71_9PEZI|nr:uncharacterized protein PV09_03956 [Verruconis gallopava]KIW04765.1 hypothetical protein PV09_03956 [Verruconis gallopava]